MASKKLKKALMAGALGFAGAKALKQAGEMKQFLATEGGDKAKLNYITKKAKPTSFKDKAIAATKKVFRENINLSRGPNIKKTDSLAGIGKENPFGLGAYDGAKAGKMIKARGGKLVNLKPTKLY
tara:strand:- start:179 stop:553 length:375 start_codon:yes stop_codon:yes gene_type:complete